MMFCLDNFVADYVIKRPLSMFKKDIDTNVSRLSEKICGKSVLVIGGAGTIGSSFIKSILPFKPSTLIVVDTNENALAELTRDLRSTIDLYIPKEYTTYPVDYASKVFAKIFRMHKGFDIVGNFSAHKHVRSEKDVFSVEALLNNNVLNAKLLLDLLQEFPPEEYFCVSTDKASNPVNIMGASKRIMEDLIFSYSDKFPVKTARFANVAFSNGSLPQGFIERIHKLQPISAPNDVKRYFVSLEESGQICMLACVLGNNREIFFPKLQETQMMSFDEIACNLLHEYGFEIVECNSDEEAVERSIALKNGGNLYPVHFSKSDTSGEKSYEEFYTESELKDLKRFCSLGVIVNKGMPNKERLDSLLNNLKEIFKRTDVNKNTIVNVLKDYLPNFNHIETGKSLDNKM